MSYATVKKTEQPNLRDFKGTILTVIFLQTTLSFLLGSSWRWILLPLEKLGNFWLLH